MKLLAEVAVVSAFLGVAAYACSEAKPAAAPAKTTKTDTSTQQFPQNPSPPSPPIGDNTGTGTNGTTDITPNCTQGNDFFQLKFSQEITDCLKTDKIYNFDAKKCTVMFNAKDILSGCTYAAIRAQLQVLGLSTANLDAQEAKGYKVIQCGTSNDGNTIVTQHWEPAPDATKDCTFTNQGKVTSLCFRKFIGTTPDAMPTTEAEKKAYVAKCMDEALQ